MYLDPAGPGETHGDSFHRPPWGLVPSAVLYVQSGGPGRPVLYVQSMQAGHILPLCLWAWPCLCLTLCLWAWPCLCLACSCACVYGHGLACACACACEHGHACDYAVVKAHGSSGCCRRPLLVAEPRMPYKGYSLMVPASAATTTYEGYSLMAAATAAAPTCRCCTCPEGPPRQPVLRGDHICVGGLPQPGCRQDL